MSPCVRDRWRTGGDGAPRRPAHRARPAGLHRTTRRAPPGRLLRNRLPGNAWQRGTNENTNGWRASVRPKGTDLSLHGTGELEAVAAALNGRPRKTLEWRTPAEAPDDLLVAAQSASVATTGRDRPFQRHGPGRVPAGARSRSFFEPPREPSRRCRRRGLLRPARARPDRGQDIPDARGGQWNALIPSRCSASRRAGPRGPGCCCPSRSNGSSYRHPLPSEKPGPFRPATGTTMTRRSSGEARRRSGSSPKPVGPPCPSPLIARAMPECPARPPGRTGSSRRDGAGAPRPAGRGPASPREWRPARPPWTCR